MELETKVIHKNKMPIEVMSQLIAEEDYNLPEYKPDIKYVIKSHGNIVVEEVASEEEYVSVKGKMQFAILYQGEGGESLVDQVNGSIPFTERLHVEGAMRSENVTVRTQMEDLGVVVINSRKLSLRGLANVMVCICEGVADDHSKQYIKDQNVQIHTVLHDIKECHKCIPRMKAGIQQCPCCHPDKKRTVHFLGY